jgi:hypothetical protein
MNKASFEAVLPHCVGDRCFAGRKRSAQHIPQSKSSKAKGISVAILKQSLTSQELYVMPYDKEIRVRTAEGQTWRAHRREAGIGVPSEEGKENGGTDDYWVAA